MKLLHFGRLNPLFFCYSAAISRNLIFSIFKEIPFLFLIQYCLQVRAPVQVFGIEGRYATALYSAASKQVTLVLS